MSKIFVSTIACLIGSAVCCELPASFASSANGRSGVVKTKPKAFSFSQQDIMRSRGTSNTSRDQKGLLPRKPNSERPTGMKGRAGKLQMKVQKATSKGSQEAQ